MDEVVDPLSDVAQRLRAFADGFDPGVVIDEASRLRVDDLTLAADVLAALAEMEAGDPDRARGA